MCARASLSLRERGRAAHDLARFRSAAPSAVYGCSRVSSRGTRARRGQDDDRTGRRERRGATIREEQRFTRARLEGVWPFLMHGGHIRHVRGGRAGASSSSSIPRRLTITDVPRRGAVPYREPARTAPDDGHRPWWKYNMFF